MTSLCSLLHICFIGHTCSGGCCHDVSFTSFVFVLVFIDLTFLFLFLSVFKNSKTIKIEKSSKSLIACFVYIICEFGLIPLYLWHSAFTSLAC